MKFVASAVPQLDKKLIMAKSFVFVTFITLLH